MNRFIYTFAGVIAFLFLLSGSSNLSASQSFFKNNYEQQILTEWVEYVLIGTQWFKITHSDDGCISVEPVSKPNSD